MNHPVISRLSLPLDMKILIYDVLCFEYWKAKMKKLNRQYRNTWYLTLANCLCSIIPYPGIYMNWRVTDAMIHIYNIRCRTGVATLPKNYLPHYIP